MKRLRISTWLRTGILTAALVCCSAKVYALTDTLEYKHSAGTSLTYQLTIDSPGPQNSYTVDMGINRNTVAVTSGNMEVHTIVNSGTKTIEGITSSLDISGDVMTTILNPRGTVSSTTATGDLSSIFGQAGVGTASTSPDLFRSLGVLEFPVGDVSDGATWSVSKNHTFANGDTLQITYDYTLDSEVAHGGYQCARILFSANPQFSFFQDFPDLLNGMKVNGALAVSGELLFAYTEGRVVRLNETITANQVGIIVGYDGMAQVVPSYRQTTISLEIQ